MVHHSFSSKSAKYSLRGRKGATDALSSDDLRHPAAHAIVGSGLRPGMLTLPAEKKRYSGNRSEYLEARDFVLLKWDEDHTRFLSEDACVGAAPEGRRRMVREVYRFLHHQGCINFGILKDDPLVPLPPDFFPAADPAPDTEPPPTAEDAPKPEATDDAIAARLYEVLEGVDLESTSEKMLRAQLGEYFGVDMSSKKALIRELVTAYLESGGPPASYKEKKAKEAAAEEKSKRPRKPLGRVVVIGAGPAGLTAALHLKRNNIEAVVLEARDRVGGRVNSHTAPGFLAPVDLGASIITGTEPDVRRGLRADPSSTLCAQLGVKLHELKSDVLPLYDSATGGILDEDLDKTVERLRDGIMDDAAAILEDLPPAEQEAASFGAMLERAMAQWETREATKAGSEEPEAKAAEAEAAPTAAAAASAPEEGKAAETDEAPTAAAPMEEATAAGTGEAPTAAAAAEEAEKANAEDANGGAPAAAEPEEAVQVQEEGQPGKDAEGAATALPDLPSAEDGADKEATGDASAGPIAVPRHAEAAPQPTAGDTIANGTVPQKDHLPSEDGTTPAAAAALPAKLSADHLRVLNWHWANLEYGCSAPLNALSAEHWNQDEDFGGFGGPHCMVVGGYDQVFRRLASLLDVRLSTRVASIKTRQEMDSVEVITAAGESIWADAVVVTVPLGVLKAGGLAFDPPLPQWKQDAVQKLGFGDLNKVVLQFPSVFWDDSVDFFGAVHSEHNDAERGWNYMFWNFHRFSGVPILAALVAGEAAKAAETLEESELSARAMATLRTLHPGSTIPEPVAVAVSRWASEPFSRGSYSYVSVGATGEDYDQLAKPVARRVLFAGEHTVKEHPDTVGGAMLSGLREAVRALDILIADKREGVAMAAEVSEAVAQLKRKQSEGAERGGRSKKPKSSGNGRSENRTRGRSGSGDDVDMGQDDDDLEARFDRAMGRDVARMQEEMRVREAARQATKEFWRGLMAAESGDAAVFADVLQGTAAEDVQARTTAARCLSQAPSKAMKTIARDERTMQLFTEWVVDAAGDNSLIALLDLLLKALRVMPVDAAMAEKTGLLKVVRQRCAIHSDPDVRKLAGYISRSWVTPPAAGAGSAAPGSKPAAVPPAPKKVELDEETKRKLEEAEAEIRRLDEMAAALRAQAEAKKQTASSFADDGPLRALPSFQEYKEALKGNKKKPKAKMERISERQAGAGGSGGATNGGGSGPLDVRQRLEKMVADFLKPFYERRQVNKEQFKAIVAKTREKVLSKATETDLANGKKFLDGRRQGIGRLVADYVAAYSQKR